MESESESEPTIDDLTGLFRCWWPSFVPERAALWLAEMPADTVLIWIGLRDFRRINNEFGFVAGNQVLAEVGRRLRIAVDPWPAYRYGGDEFLIAVRLPGEDQVRTYVSDLLAILEKPHGELGIVLTWAAAARANAGEESDRLLERLSGAVATVFVKRWAGLIVAPPDANGRTIYAEPPVKKRRRRC